MKSSALFLAARRELWASEWQVDWKKRMRHQAALQFIRLLDLIRELLLTVI